MKIKSFISVLLCGTMLSGIVPVVQAEEVKGTRPEKPTWYIWQDTNSVSSWEANKTASGSSTVASKEVMGFGVYNDSSEYLPVSGNRETVPISGGKLTLEFGFALDREMDGTAFRLLDGKKTAFGIVTKNSGLYLEQPNGELCYLTSYSTSRIIDSYAYDVKAEIDMDTKMIENVYINGALYAVNEEFAEKISQITSFDFATTNEAVGNLSIRYVKLYGGYNVYEMFMSGNGLPSDWTMNGNGSAGLRVFNYRYVDRNSLEINSEKGNVEYIKKIDSLSGKITFETQMLLPKKKGNIEIALMNDEGKVFSFISGEEDFAYLSNAGKTNFYNYMENVWYRFRAELDLDNHTANIYLNGKLKSENVPIRPASDVNTVKLFVPQGEGTAVFDDIILHQTPQTPSDYVPEPQSIASDEYAIGMQMCPLWTEGTHNGWDEMNAAKGRIPVLGYYDEGDPEYSDWAIKYMAEHGINFWLPCMYTCYALEEAERDPIKDNSFRHGYAIHNGYFHAKYSDDMPFAILWENGGYLVGRATEKDFFGNLVPFWIEYYFKDPRYFRLNGRPVMSILNPGNFFSIFEGNARNDEAVLSGIQKFRDMCIEAGVGDPILMINTTALNNTYEDIDRWDKMGLEGFSKYNYGIYGNLESHKEYLNTYKEHNKDNSTLEIFPALCTGFNGVWDSSGRGYESTPKEYKSFLEWMKDEYLPSLPKSKFEKRVMVAATWDEFGEGTIICPTQKYGFGHLDAIRDVFIGESEHEDIIPTAEQKARINNMYNPDRDAGYTKEHVLPDVKTQVPILSWDFSQSMGDWSISGGISNVKYENGAATIELNGTNPTIALSDSNIDLYNINYMKVTMKAGVSKGGTVTWTTNKDTGVDNHKYRVMPMQGEENGEFIDYYIPIGENYEWSGVLGQLTFVLGQFYNTDEDIRLKSIELLGNADTSQSKLKMGNYHVPLDIITENDGVNYVDIKTLAKELGGNLSRVVKTDSGIVKIGSNATIITNGLKTASKKDVAVELTHAPFMRDGKFYVSIDSLNAITGSGFSYDEMNKVLECTTLESEADSSSREVIKEYLFETADDIAGMSFNSNISSKTFGDGGVKLGIVGGDPYFRIVEDIDASKVKRIEVGMSSGVASTGQIYFVTTAATNMNEAKSFKFALSASKETKNYLLNCENNSSWNGTVTQLRVDPAAKEGAGSWVKIDYIRLLGDVIEIPGEEKVESCVKVTDNSYSWEFDANTTYDGFAPSKHIADLKAENGELSFRASGIKPVIETENGVSIDADKYQSLQIKLKNNTAGNYMRVYFYTNDEGVVNSQCGYEVATTAYDESGSTYEIDLTQNSNWNGTVKGLLLEFPGEQGTIKIDSIKLQ